MLRTEAITGRGRLAVPERRFVRDGVMVVVAHSDKITGEVSLGLITHIGNGLKGINAGDLGFPSETLEKDKKDNDIKALLRCFREELGIVDHRRMGLYRSSEENAFHHEFNLDTGLNGDSSNAAGVGTVLWTRSIESIVSVFEQGMASGLVDQTEVAGLRFIPVSEIMDENSGLALRRAPDPRRITRQLLEQGLLIDNGV